MASLQPAAQRIPVLMYHRIGEPANDADRRYCVRPDDFARQMRELSARGHTGIALEAFFAWLDGREILPQGAFLLTFDDGFRGVRKHALPVLDALSWRCAVFVVSGLIGGCDLWNGARRPGSAALLTSGEILEMAARGVSFESHTRTHRRLPALSDKELGAELALSRSELEALLGRPVRYLAYPFGALDERTIAAAQEAGYEGAFCTEPGFNRRHVDRYRMRRLEVAGTDSPARLARKMALGENGGSVAAMVRYLGRRMARGVCR